MFSKYCTSMMSNRMVRTSSKDIRWGVSVYGDTPVVLSQTVTVDSDKMMQFKLSKKNLTAEGIESLCMNRIRSIQNYSPVLAHCAHGPFCNILRALHVGPTMTRMTRFGRCAITTRSDSARAFPSLSSLHIRNHK